MDRDVFLYREQGIWGGFHLPETSWDALASAGWLVGWFYVNPDSTGPCVDDGSGPIEQPFLGIPTDDWLTPVTKPDPTVLYLGGVANTAIKLSSAIAATLAEWTAVTGEDPDELGCGCCSFYRHEFAVFYEGSEAWADMSRQVTTIERTWGKAETRSTAVAATNRPDS